MPFQLDPSVVITGAGRSTPFGRWRASSTSALPHVTASSAGQVSASFDAEASEVSDDSPTFSQPTVTIMTERAFVPVSLELIDDVPTLAEEVGRLFADAIDNSKREKFSNGTGDFEPAGTHLSKSTTRAAVPS